MPRADHKNPRKTPSTIKIIEITMLYAKSKLGPQIALLNLGKLAESSPVSGLVV